MKTRLLFISIILAVTVTATGQNYIGMSQSKIIKTFGEPDEKGSNYFTYNNIVDEGGSNIYYFDESENCISFVLTRTNVYFDDYQKMLENEFTKTDINKYVRKKNKYNFLAEITKSQDKFQIRVQHLNTL